MSKDFTPGRIKGTGLPEETWGEEQYRTDPDGCCAVRKVQPRGSWRRL
jgi:hypothetical protein